MTEDGGCPCGDVRYRLLKAPLFIHCCHCSWCQRETGSAFALNALIEANNVELLTGSLESVDTPSASGRGQKITLCHHCRVALWSNYSGAGDAIHFIRVGALDNAAEFHPDIHIFTSTRQPWLKLTGEIPVMAEYYDWRECWPESSIRRYRNAVNSSR